MNCIQNDMAVVNIGHSMTVLESQGLSLNRNGTYDG